MGNHYTDLSKGNTTLQRRIHDNYSFAYTCPINDIVFRDQPIAERCIEKITNKINQCVIRIERPLINGPSALNGKRR